MRFLKKKNIIISVDRYLIKAMSSMALGLFATLLVGTILQTLGTLTKITFLTDTLVTINETPMNIGGLLSIASGPAMCVAIGYALEAPNLVLYSLISVGLVTNAYGGAGGPLAVLVVGIIATEVGKLVSGETKIDILVTPIVTILTGVGLAYLIAGKIGTVALKLGNIIMWAVECEPFIMGMVVAVIIGIALTLPISSAAICASLGLVGLAGGAALAGCSAQMIGFAVISFRVNKLGGLISQGIGTSMLQMGNIIKNPKIWIAPILTSAITGPIATCIFKLEMNGSPVSSGMGTCGMVGPIGVYTGWINDISSGLKDSITAFDIIGLALIVIVLPAIIAPIINKVLIKLKLVKYEDFKL